MKKILFLLITSSFIHFHANAQIKLLDFISPAAGATNPTHIDSLGKGGYMVVPVILDRNNIPTSRRKYGMLVYVQNLDSTYKLGSPSLDNSNWITMQTYPTTSAIPVSKGGTGQSTYTDGQLLIGNSNGNTLTPATLRAGDGVTITNGNGSILLSATGTGGTVTSVNPIELTTDGSTYSSSVDNANTTPTITMNIPSASVTGTTAGLISNIDYANFNAKVNVVDTAAMLAKYARRFTRDVTLNISSSKSLGKYKTGEVIPAAGKTLDEFLADIATETIPATYTAPTVLMTNPTSQIVEIGTNPGTITLSSNYTKNDGGDATSRTYFKNGSSLGTAVTSAVGSITSDTKYKVTVEYAQGPVKNDNLGNPSPSGQISAGSVTSSEVTYTPRAKKYWGASTTNVPIDNSILIGNSSEFYTSQTKSEFTIPISDSPKYVFYAYPASGPDLTDISVGGFDSLESFTKSTVNITNAQGYTQSYKLYVSNNNFSVPVDKIIIK